MFRLRRVRRSSPTILALTEDGEVRPVDREPAFVGQSSDQAVDQIVGCVDDATTSVADHVNVFIIRESKGRRAVAEMGVPEQAELLEQLNRAIDGGRVDIGDGGTDSFRRRVFEGAHRVQHLPALGSHSQTPLMQPLCELGVRNLVGGHASIVSPLRPRRTARRGETLSRCRAPGRPVSWSHTREEVIR